MITCLTDIKYYSLYLSPNDRGLLSPASGFDSAQFRMIEISLGLREDKRSEKSPCPYM